MHHQIDANVRQLRPTQISVAMARVAQARAQIRGAVLRHQLNDFLTWRPVSGVLGPRGAVFVTDDHHIARALAEEGIETCIVVIHQDLSHVLPDRFWIAMERLGLVHPVDAGGRRRAFAAIPQQLAQLAEDPYRDLALNVRDCGGCKDWDGAAAEIQWANFLRTRVPTALLAGNEGEALRAGLSHARSEAARRLPGWKPA
jgi:hypothetical protein